MTKNIKYNYIMKNIIYSTFIVDIDVYFMLSLYIIKEKIRVYIQHIYRHTADIAN